MINSVLLEVSGPQRENASELNQMLELHILSFSQTASISAILNFIVYSLFLVHLYSSTSCKPSSETTIPNFQES